MKELKEYLRGRFFYAKWRKKDGELREGVFRFAVKEWKDQDDEDRAVQGIGLAYDPDKYNLALVFDVHKRGHRMIWIPGLIEVRSGALRFTREETVEQ